MPRPATLADIAKAAELHPTTVSRVLRRSPDLNVREETRARVERIAVELGYRPNAVARGLAMKEQGTRSRACHLDFMVVMRGVRPQRG